MTKFLLHASWENGALLVLWCMVLIPAFSKIVKSVLSTIVACGTIYLRKKSKASILFTVPVPT